MSTARTLWMTALLLLPMSWAGAQNFDFHAPTSASDPTAPAVMRDLAERILPVYQENNPERYLENLSALQLTADSYAAATETRKSLRERRLSTSTVRPNGRSVLYDIYTQARATEAASKVPFEQAFTQAFQDQLSHLSDQDAYAVTSWHGPPLSTLEAAVQSGFDQHRAQDSIPVADAVELIRTFLAFDATRSYGPLLGALDTEDDQRRYTAEQHVTIKTPRGNIAALLVLPKGADKALPALLEYTIYANSPNYAKECAAHGYAGVVAYVRETPGDPSYRVVPFQNDGDDVRAVIGWIAAQSWSDGRVGMYGGDYSGFTPWGRPPSTAGAQGHCHIQSDRTGRRLPDARQHLPQLRLSLGLQRHQQEGLGRHLQRRALARARADLVSKRQILL
jgi:hypothetical protein